MDKCTGCAVCTEYCPVQYPDPFNQNISRNKAIHVYFSQAFPLVAYIDESCRYLKEKTCALCEGVCKADAIDFHQKPQKVEINVGAVILAAGLEPYDPRANPEYHYGEFVNVVTSMDFERLLSATGAYSGEILRASDLKHPHKIAWISCVGSRRVTEGENSYCSGVCCTYNQKQVILTKEHDAAAECTIFHNDIRSFGKDFERFYQRTADLPGVRFVRSYVSIVREDPVTKNVTIRYSTPDDGVREEEFEMVVLSVGLNPPAEAQAMAGKFGIDLNAHGFCLTDSAKPMETSRAGIFVSGGFQGPADIPDSVLTASAAGSQCGELLNYRRGKLSTERVYPQERDVSGEAPRIGVFVCHCGANIGRIVNVPDVVEYALTLPNVVHSQEQLFSCATNSSREITDMTREKGLNRVVVAACSPRTLEPLFRDTVREAGINQYYYEMANIREHNSWVHAREKEDATQKAKDLIRMSVARARSLEPLPEYDLSVDKTALVVGGGVAGMTCSLSIADQGHEVYLVEKEKELGGTARRIHYTLEGMDVQVYLNDLIRKVYRHPLVHVHTGATITEAGGYIGNFVTWVKSDRGPAEIRHGATVIAIGAQEYRPAEYLYGQDERVLTQLDLEEWIAEGDEKIVNAGSVVMIQCVGCRNEERNYCSKICCTHAIKNALKLKEKNPGMDVSILFRDMRTYGYAEDYYRQASEKDVKFIRFEPEDAPQVETVEEEGKPVLRVTTPDYILGAKMVLDADYLVLSAAAIPSAATQDVASLFKVTLNPDGFFKEAHVKLRPVEFGTDGVYLCGMAQYPKHISETVSQAYGAAGRVLTLLSRDIVTASGAVAQVDEGKCVSCGACITVCSYGAIDFYESLRGRRARVNPVLCKGDGVCNTVCPTSAVSLKHFTDEEIWNQIDAAVQEEETVSLMGTVC
ncbi:heterodisulfide reductase, subunit A [Syntrophus aciditrophicus SB]|uniref:Heterodisulfide reductase, subunit A n=3 Tax=Syntrophus TaxID=43773 RepID=Q2LXC7_SYNAS|nr:heterodisulfide reductase, subunit A [Syntrophus aciditrophicus SB]